MKELKLHKKLGMKKEVHTPIKNKNPYHTQYKRARKERIIRIIGIGIGVLIMVFFLYLNYTWRMKMVDVCIENTGYARNYCLYISK